MRRDDDPARRLAHDAEETVRKGMSVEGQEVDEAETLASTGNLESSFQEIVSGSATGIGLDREETAEGSAPVSEAERVEFLGPRGAAPDEDPSEGDDSWLQDMPRDLR